MLSYIPHTQRNKGAREIFPTCFSNSYSITTQLLSNTWGCLYTYVNSNPADASIHIDIFFLKLFQEFSEHTFSETLYKVKLLKNKVSFELKAQQLFCTNCVTVSSQYTL